MSEDITPETHMKQILERVRPGGLWEPSGYGLIFVREEGNKLKLLQQMNNPISAQMRIRIRVLLGQIGWDIDESETQLVDAEQLSPQEQHMKEMEFRQEMAQNWNCECRTPISAFPLEQGRWVFRGEQEMITPDGRMEKAENWIVEVDCPVCDSTIPMEPYDYGLVAGDEAMIKYLAEGNGFAVVYEALTRMEIIERVDRREELTVVGTFCPITNTLLPPHVRGSVATLDIVRIQRDEEE